MRSSNENKKRRGFSAPRRKKGVEKTGGYPKNDEFAQLLSTPPPIGTLAEGIVRVFVDANPRRIEKWVLKCEPVLSEPELILFATLLCGCHFRIVRPDVPSTLGQLWTWLTQHPRSMNEELAELLVDSLAPILAQSIEKRGLKKGWPEGSFERERGRPPQARGALVATVIAQSLLTQRGIRKNVALTLVTDLASILLGRQHVERLEIYRFRKQISPETISSISEEISKWYEWLLVEDGARTNDRKLEDQQPEQQAEWRQRHKNLSQTLYSYGWEPLAAHILYRIPMDLWKPFWRHKASKDNLNDTTVK